MLFFSDYGKFGTCEFLSWLQYCTVLLHNWYRIRIRGYWKCRSENATVKNARV